MRNPADFLQATFDSFDDKLAQFADFAMPRRKFILTGELVHDCEQFAVWASAGPYAGFPGSQISSYQPSTGGNTALSMNVYVSVCREVWNVDNAALIPPESELTAGSLVAARDAAVLTEVFYAAMADNSIGSACDVAFFGGVGWIGPSGGILETRLQFGMQL